MTIKNKNATILSLTENLKAEILKTAPDTDHKIKTEINLSSKIKIVIQLFDEEDARLEDGELASVDILFGNKTRKKTGFICGAYDTDFEFCYNEAEVYHNIYDTLAFQDISRSWEEHKVEILNVIQKWIEENNNYLKNMLRIIQIKKAVNHIEQVKDIYT